MVARLPNPFNEMTGVELTFEHHQQIALTAAHNQEGDSSTQSGRRQQHTIRKEGTRVQMYTLSTFETRSTQDII